MLCVAFNAFELTLLGCGRRCRRAGLPAAADDLRRKYFGYGNQRSIHPRGPHTKVPACARGAVHFYSADQDVFAYMRIEPIFEQRVYDNWSTPCLLRSTMPNPEKQLYGSVRDAAPRTSTDEDIRKAEAIRQALRRELLSQREPPDGPSVEAAAY